MEAEQEFARAAKSRMSAKARAAEGVKKIPHLKAREAAGRMAGVNPHYVTDAKKLKHARPDLLDRVRLGELTLASAMQQIKAPAGKRAPGAEPTHKVSIVFLGQKFTCADQPEAAARMLAAAFVDKDIAVRIRDKRADKAQKMYADAKTWNPFKGCGFACVYCIPSFQRQAKRRKHDCRKCYEYKPHEHSERLGRIPDSGTVFVCGDADISFCETSFIREIIAAIKAKNESNAGKGKPLQTFYMQSKRPRFFRPFLKDLPENVILLTTLETNRDKGYGKISKAPPPSARYKQFLELDYPRKIVTAEPLLDFDVEEFGDWIAEIKPEHVWLGYNSHEAEPPLPEPPHRKVVGLAESLLKRGIKIKGKDLRGLDMPEGVERTQD